MEFSLVYNFATDCRPVGFLVSDSVPTAGIVLAFYDDVSLWFVNVAALFQLAL
jgi:hypothetical protein